MSKNLSHKYLFLFKSGTATEDSCHIDFANYRGSRPRSIFFNYAILPWLVHMVPPTWVADCGHSACNSRAGVFWMGC